MGRLRTFAFGKFAFTAAFVLSTLVLGHDADAGVQWCESDPVFLVNGAIVDVTTDAACVGSARLSAPLCRPVSSRLWSVVEHLQKRHYRSNERNQKAQPAYEEATV